MNREVLKNIANYCDTSGCTCGHADRKRRAVAALVEAGLGWEVVAQLGQEELEAVNKKLSERGSVRIVSGSPVLLQLEVELRKYE